MKISELIIALQAAQQAHGDLPVGYQLKVGGGHGEGDWLKMHAITDAQPSDVREGRRSDGGELVWKSTTWLQLK